MLTRDEISLVKGMLKRGDRQSDIAAWFGTNSGRIAEVSTGERGPTVRAAPEKDLPPPGPYVVVPRGWVERLANLLRNLRDREPDEEAA